MADGLKPEDEIARGGAATLFVSDPSAEAERVSQSLRAEGYLVVDVPLSMLVARVAVQRPRVILLDADMEGALDVVSRMRELPDADGIDVVFVGRVGGALSSAEDALVHEGSGYFPRPVDVISLLRKVEALTGGPRASAAGGPQSHAGGERVAERRRSSSPPPSRRSSSPPAAFFPPPPHSSTALPPASMRASDVGSSYPPVSSSGKMPIASVVGPDGERRRDPYPDPFSSFGSRQEDPPGGRSLYEEYARFAVASVPGGRPIPVRGPAAPLSVELEHLLAEAEQRVGTAPVSESAPPSPEEEIEAVLPAELLRTLDEPLPVEDDDLGEVLPVRALTGGGRPVLTPTPKTHGGTHSGTTNNTGTTGAGSEPRERVFPARLSSAGSDGPVRAPSVTPPPYSPIPSAPSLEPRPDGQRISSMLPPPPAPTVLGTGDMPRVVGRAIAMRTTGTLCVDARDGVRRVVLREGDIVTTASGADDESLVAFLGVRGELPRETVRRLAAKFPAFGRHAGAALVAHGYLRQDQLWPILRAHAEWILGRILIASNGTVVLEAEPPGRLRGEPGVFGGSTGAEVFVEVLRRVVAPIEALERLGGPSSRLGDGERGPLLSECALNPAELELVRQARGRSVGQVCDLAPDTDIATVVYSMALLGILEVLRSVGTDAVESPSGGVIAVDALDEEAIVARVRARLQLVEEGDYFAILGVPRNATGYEVRRAFLELRRAFEPARILTPQVSDLADDVRKIVQVLEEAYEILRDAARRERYRRAIDAAPGS